MVTHVGERRAAKSLRTLDLSRYRISKGSDTSVANGLPKDFWDPHLRPYTVRRRATKFGMLIHVGRRVSQEDTLGPLLQFLETFYIPYSKQILYDDQTRLEGSYS